MRKQSDCVHQVKKIFLKTHQKKREPVEDYWSVKTDGTGRTPQP